MMRPAFFFAVALNQPFAVVHYETVESVISSRLVQTFHSAAATRIRKSGCNLQIRIIQLWN